MRGRPTVPDLWQCVVLRIKAKDTPASPVRVRRDECCREGRRVGDCKAELAERGDYVLARLMLLKRELGVV